MAYALVAAAAANNADLNPFMFECCGSVSAKWNEDGIEEG
jgi:hypothetical protein